MRSVPNDLIMNDNKGFKLKIMLIVADIVKYSVDDL